MAGEGDRPELLLGKPTPLVERYAPELLYPIPRESGRRDLGLDEPLHLRLGSLARL